MVKNRFDEATTREPGISRRSALLRMASGGMAPVAAATYFLAQRDRLRRQERNEQMMANIPILASSGILRPSYNIAQLAWKPAVANQVDRDADGQLHIITDQSTFSYQVTADLQLNEAKMCFIQFNLEIIRGGASVTVLNHLGNGLISKSFDKTGNYADYLKVLAGSSRSVTVLVANNAPSKGQSEIRVTQFDVYLPTEEMAGHRG